MCCEPLRLLAPRVSLQTPLGVVATAEVTAASGASEVPVEDAASSGPRLLLSIGLAVGDVSSYVSRYMGLWITGGLCLDRE